MNEFEQFLYAGASALGTELDAQALTRFSRYAQQLRAENEVFNLTAVTEEKEIAQRHFLDSLALAPHIPAGARIIDVGSGAGFPGLPLCIARTDLHVTLADSLGKRVDFLSRTCTLLGVHAECLHARAEELSREADRRDGYDVAVSRALARLNVLAELCLPFVRPGGIFLAMKAIDCAEEVQEAKHAIEALGGVLRDVRPYDAAGVERALVVIEKQEPTPALYPRRWAKISKKPL